MKIEYLHASKYGNGAMVAEEFSKQMAAKGVTVHVHHIRGAKPKGLPPADLYLFSSSARFGKPIGSMRRFLKKVDLPAGNEVRHFDHRGGGASRPGRAHAQRRAAGKVDARPPDHE